jgi:hypothetical protein
MTVEDILSGGSANQCSNIDVGNWIATFKQYLLFMSMPATRDLADEQIRKLDQLSDQEKCEFINLFPNPDRFLYLMQQRINQQSEPLERNGAIFESQIVAPAAAPTLAVPDYGSNASGSEYKSVFLDFLAGENFIPSNTSNDARCDNEKFASFTEDLTILRVANSVGSAACQLAGCDPIGIACAVVCGLDAIVDASTEIVELTEASCNAHNGTIDSAEIEATYENSILISGQIETVDQGLHAHDANIDADLAAHDANIDADLAAHDANIDADLAAHDANIDADLAAHDANIDADLAAHDANIDADLQQHDTDIKGLIGGVQGTLDNEVELRRVHIQVVQVDKQKRYLVRTSEAGEPVEVEFLAIEVFNESTGAFQSLPSAAVNEIELGLYDLELNLSGNNSPRPAKVFRLRVRHDDTVDQFGEIIFHRDTVETGS